jgi:hypothetical protein
LLHRGIATAILFPKQIPIATNWSDYVKEVHLLCSTNWNPNVAEPDADRMLGPLNTMIGFFSDNRLSLAKLILLRGQEETDFRYCALVINLLKRQGVKVAIDDFETDNLMPHVTAARVSAAAEECRLHNADLWVDLTPGPKQRGAVIFASASAVPGVHIVYSEAAGNGQFAVREVPPMGSYNRWLGRHGIYIRNYSAEILGLAGQAEQSGQEYNAGDVAVAIADLLGPSQALASVPSPSVNLIKLAEWTWNEVVRERIFQVASEDKWRSASGDVIRTVDPKNPKLKSAGRAGQLLYQLRHLFAHAKKLGITPKNTMPSHCSTAWHFYLPGLPG